jgi:uncharacterized protein YqeY
MLLQAKIEAEFISAFKAKDTVKKDTLGIVKSKISEWLKAHPTVAISDGDIVTILASEIKKRNQTIDMYSTQLDNEQAKANMAKEQLEIYILQSFLPQQLSDEEIKIEIENVKATSPAKLMPAIMQHFSKNFKGRYDNKHLQTLIA